MSYMGKVRPTIALTSSDIEDNAVTSSKIIADAVTTAKINDGDVTTAKMAVDPTNASNLASGAVPVGQLTTIPGANVTGTIPLAALGNAPETDVTGINDDIALLGFKVASNGSLAKYNLVDQTVDDFQDASGVDSGSSTNDYRETASNYYSAVSFGAYQYSENNSSGTWTCPSDVNLARILIVAGGGGGPGSSYAGGGGAGGIINHPSYAVTPAVVYDFTVGTGGAGSGSYPGTTGVDSTFNNNDEGSGTILTAKGGGGGAGHTGGGASTPQDGGSGGGGGGGSGAGGSEIQTSQSGDSGTYGFGNDGGGGHGSSSDYGGGGGGGAGAEGSDGNTAYTGGAGKDFSSDFGTSYGVSGWFGGGGGASGNSNSGAGGQGGGGAGAVGTATAGTANTGGGGGGGYGGTGGAGGSGVIILKYRTESVNSAMTLVSASTTAQAAPTKGDIVLTYTNGAGTATIGTDLTVEFSADNGSNWTDFGISASDVEGTTGGHTIISKHDVALTSASGTSMRYRLKTLNQSAAKDTRIQAVSLGWS